MKRIVYSPQTFVYIRTISGVNVDLSEYVVSGSITRRVNALSTAEIVIRNPGKQFTSPGNPTFHPMDPITIFMSRQKNPTTGEPIRVQMFTGYLDQTPWFQLVPGQVTLRASCTLKKLQQTYWDPALPFSKQFLSHYGWIPLPNGQVVNPAQQTRNLTQQQSDGSSSATEPSTSRVRNSKRVLLLGDSLAERTYSHLKKALKTYTVSKNAVEGRTTTQAFENIKLENDLPDTVVIQLGTNDSDSEVFKTAAYKIIEKLGDRRIIWVNVNRTKIPNSTQINNVLKAAARKYDNVEIFDYNKLVADSTIDLSGDGVHPTTYSLLGRKLGSAVKNGGGTTTSEPTSGGSTGTPPPQPDAKMTDGSFGALMYGILKHVGGWRDQDIFIEKLPEDLTEAVIDIYHAFDAEAQQAKETYSSMMKEAIGTSSYGGGGNNSGNVTDAKGGPESFRGPANKWGRKYGIDPHVLMAIAKVETDFGRNNNTSSAGARGFMQFMPATRKHYLDKYGVDAWSSSISEAVHAAALYLMVAGYKIGDITKIRKAIFAYNHANWYVDKVLLLSKDYKGDPSSSEEPVPTNEAAETATRRENRSVSEIDSVVGDGGSYTFASSTQDELPPGKQRIRANPRRPDGTAGPTYGNTGPNYIPGDHDYALRGKQSLETVWRRLVQGEPDGSRDRKLGYWLGVDEDLNPNVYGEGRYSEAIQRRIDRKVKAYEPGGSGDGGSGGTSTDGSNDGSETRRELPRNPKNSGKGAYIGNAVGPVEPNTDDLAQQLFELGYNVTSAKRNRNDNSQHNIGQALDFGDQSNDMESLWAILYPLRRHFNQLLGPTRVPNGGLYGPGAEPNALNKFTDQGLQDDHQDHIHVGLIPNKSVNIYTATTSESEDGDVTVGGGGGGELTVEDILTTAKASAFATEFAFPTIEQTVEAMALGGQRSLMNDQPLLPFVQQLAAASMRSFQSAPNGKFFAFYPDYFGTFNARKPFWVIDDTEIIDGNIQLTDEALATHVYVVGDTMPPFGQIGGTGPFPLEKAVSGGVVTIFNAFQTEFVLNHAETVKGSTKKSGDKAGQDPVEEELGKQNEKELSKYSLGRKELALRFLQRYGARPYYNEEPLIRSQFFEAFNAFMTFQLLWSRQFLTTFRLTFMPELYPGGTIAFKDYGLQMYIDSVTHTFDYTGGFFTNAQLSAPSSVRHGSVDRDPEKQKVSLGMVNAITDENVTKAGS